MTALAALTERVVLSTLRDLDVLFAILVPVVTVVGFNLALRNVIDTGGMSYIQYVLPAVVVQAMLIGALGRRSASPGSLYSYATDSLPPPAAAIAAWALVLGYIATGCSIVGGFVQYFCCPDE